MSGDTRSWRESRFAPPPGTSLGGRDSFPDRGVRELQFGPGRRAFSMLVVRRGDDFRGYVNACPHVWLPLTFRSARLLSADGERLVCSNHFAEFSVDDGHAVSGPVAPGCGLAAIPLQVNAAGEIVIGGSAE